MVGKKLKFILGIALLVIIVIATYVFYLYEQGSMENYKPPVETVSPQTQILNDMTLLSGVVEAYFVKNLRYPERLEQLEPEFINKIPPAAGAEKTIIYQSDDPDHYRITVTDASRYGLKELFIENGKITQK
jgi:hypothetical protein